MRKWPLLKILNFFKLKKNYLLNLLFRLINFLPSFTLLKLVKRSYS